MEWPGPVVLDAARPGRGRHRMNSEHPNRQPVFYQDPNGFLVPAGQAAAVAPMPPPIHHRAASVAAPRPASVIINNPHWNQWDDHSPVRHHRRGSHGHELCWDDDSDFDDRHHTPPHRRRAHSHARSHSRSPSPYYDPVLDRRLDKLAKLEKEEEKKAQRERFEEEQILKAERKKRKEKEEEEMKKRWVEEAKIKEEEEKRKKEKKQKEEDEKHREWTLKRFAAAGYSEESVEKILKQVEKQKEREKEGHRGDKHLVKYHGAKPITDLTRPTYIKVNKKYLATETLDHYDYDWEWDSRDSNFIIIKQWVPEYDQERMFEHSRKLRERKLLENTTVELRKERGKLQLVERKTRSPSHARSRSRSRSWMFT